MPAGDEEAMYIYLDLSEMPGSTSLSNTEVEIKVLIVVMIAFLTPYQFRMLW